MLSPFDCPWASKQRVKRVKRVIGYPPPFFPPRPLKSILKKNSVTSGIQVREAKIGGGWPITRFTRFARSCPIRWRIDHDKQLI